MTAPAPTDTPDDAQDEQLEAPPAADALGAMIALYPPEDVVQALVAAGAVTDPSDLHVTVAYVGDAEGVDPAVLLEAAQAAAAGMGPVVGEISGHARFTGGEQDVLVALVDSPDLETLRAAVIDSLLVNGIDPVLNHGYTAHITLGYLAPDAPSPMDRLEPIPVSFDVLAAVHADTRTDTPLTETSPGANKPGDDNPDAADAAAPPEGKSAPGENTESEGKAFSGKKAPPFGKGKGDEKTPGVSTGAYVTVGNVKGRVDLVVTSGDVPGATGSDDKPVTGSKTNPAVRVVVFEPAGGGLYKATKRKIAVPASKVKRSAPLRTAEAKSLEEALVGMVLDHAETAEELGADVPGQDALTQVYERGVKSWPGEATTALTAEQWGLGRVEAFLATAVGMRPSPSYVHDDDLLPGSAA